MPGPAPTSWPPVQARRISTYAANVCDDARRRAVRRPHGGPASSSAVPRQQRLDRPPPRGYRKLGGDAAAATKLLRTVRKDPPDHACLPLRAVNCSRKPGRPDEAESPAAASVQTTATAGRPRRAFSSIRRARRRRSAACFADQIGEPAVRPDLAPRTAAAVEPPDQPGPQGPHIATCAGSGSRAHAEPASGSVCRWRAAPPWNRASLADASLERAVKIARPSRRRSGAMVDVGPSPLWDEQRSVLPARPGDAVRSADDGSPALELERRGLLLQKKADEASHLLADSPAQTDAPPPPELPHTGGGGAAETTRAFEQLAWRLVSDRPRFEPVLPALFRHYMERGNGQRRETAHDVAGHVPDSVDARVAEAPCRLGARAAGEQAAARRRAVRADPDNAGPAGATCARYAEWNQLHRAHRPARGGAAAPRRTAPPSSSS